MPPTEPGREPQLPSAAPFGITGREPLLPTLARHLPAVTPEGRIRLNRKLPFVDTVFRVIECNAPLEEAVRSLEEIERAFGVFVIADDLLGGWPGDFGRIKRQCVPSVEELLARIGDSDWCDRVFEDVTADDHEEWVRRALHPYMTEVQLCLPGGDFSNDYCFFGAEGVLASPISWRGWGGIVADWANLFWPPRSKEGRPQLWDYMDFYMRIGEFHPVEDFDAWCETVRDVLREKNRRLRERVFGA